MPTRLLPPFRSQPATLVLLRDSLGLAAISDPETASGGATDFSGASYDDLRADVSFASAFALFVDAFSCPTRHLLRSLGVSDPL